MKLEKKHVREIKPLLKTVDAVRTETKEDDFYFDPEKEITTEDWQWISEYIRDRGFFEGPNLDRVVNSIALLYPQMVSELPLPSEYRKKLDDEFVASTNKERDVYTFVYGAALRLMYPDDRTTEILNAKYDAMRKKMDEYLNGPVNIVNFILCYPDKPYFGVGKTAEDIWLKNKDRLQEYDQPYVFAQQAAHLSLLVPEHKREITVSDEMWWKMKERFNELRSERNIGDVMEFVELFFDMTILTSDKAEITFDGQIKITPKPKPLQTIEPLPQRPA